MEMISLALVYSLYGWFSQNLASSSFPSSSPLLLTASLTSFCHISASPSVVSVDSLSQLVCTFSPNLPQEPVTIATACVVCMCVCCVPWQDSLASFREHSFVIAFQTVTVGTFNTIVSPPSGGPLALYMQLVRGLPFLLQRTQLRDCLPNERH